MHYDAQTITKKMRSITLADRMLFESYLLKYPQENAQLTFAGLYLWGDSRKHIFCEMNDHLIISFQKPGEYRKWYPPLGPKPEKIISEILTPSQGFLWGYVDEKTVKKIPGNLKIEYEDGHSDYVYEIQKLRDLKGGDYVSKRNFIKRCIQQYHPEVASLNSSMRNECIALAKNWRQEKERPRMDIAEEEISALSKAMHEFEKANLTGIGVRVNGVLVSFAIGTPLNSTMFVEHIEKALDEYVGLFPFTLHEFVKLLPSTYTLLNREVDSGIPGLRLAKKRWHPVQLINKYTVST